MYKSVGDVCSQILANPSPVLFADTCSILNIINSLHMHSLPDKYAMSARDLIHLHERNVWLVTNQNVKEEWDDNIDAVIETMKKEVLKADRNISSMIAVTNALLNASYAVPQKISDLSMSIHMRALSEKFLDKCLLLERTDQHTIKAMQRVRKNEAPARKGKPEPKDCEIVESFIELGQKLRSIGFEGRLLFFTANKDDFGTSRNPKPPLDRQFSDVNAELISDINHALAIARDQA